MTGLEGRRIVVSQRPTVLDIGNHRMKVVKGWVRALRRRDLAGEIRAFRDAGIDGYFTDNPGVASS